MEVFVGFNLAYLANIKSLRDVLIRLVGFNKIGNLYNQLYNERNINIENLNYWYYPNDIKIARAFVRIRRRIIFNSEERLVKEWMDYFGPAFLSCGILSMAFLVVQGLKGAIKHEFLVIMISVLFLVHLVICFLKSFEMTKFLRDSTNKSCAVFRYFIKLEYIILHYVVLLLSLFLLYFICLMLPDSIDICFFSFFSNCFFVKFFYFSPVLAFLSLMFRVFLHIIYEFYNLKFLLKEYRVTINEKYIAIKNDKKKHLEYSERLKNRLLQKRKNIN